MELESPTDTVYNLETATSPSQSHQNQEATKSGKYYF